MFQHLTLHTDISDNYIRNVCCDNLLSDIYKIQQDSCCEKMEQWERRLLKSVCGAVWRIPTCCDFLSFVDETYCTDMLTFLNRMSHFVLHNSYCSSWPMKWPAAHFCTVLLTCGVAAWTDCWLCDSVQKYCCTVTGGGIVNWFKSNCSQISSPSPLTHHHHIFSWSTTCIAERKNICKAYTTLYILYILQYIYDYISLSSS